VKYVAYTLWHEAKIGCFTPYEKIQTHIKQLSLLCLLLILRKSVWMNKISIFTTEF